MGGSKLKIIKDLAANFLLLRKYDLFYIVEKADWAIKKVGEDIALHLNEEGYLRAKITTTPWGIKNKIIHFGSLNTFLTPRRFKKIHPSNKIVVTCFHLDPKNPGLKHLKSAAEKIDLFHTAALLTKKQLEEQGVPAKKIIVIPLGVDLSLFHPVPPKKKKAIRQKLGLPLSRPIIGSFQKDGVGWGRGLKPKLIKGPDIFIKVIARLKKYRPFILLTGPARGYVKKELRKLDVPYKHFYLKNYQDLPLMYQALDLYLVTSRIEGGPKAILESWASGIPVVSTNVGMIPDIVEKERDILMSESNNVEGLSQRVSQVIENDELSKRIIKNGLITVKDYSWENIARKYYNLIYKKIK